jgi:hypothetical protein
MTKRRTICPGEIEGFLSGCPFCSSRRIGIPQIGERFRIIFGSGTGKTGTVVEWPNNLPKIENEFLAQMDYESPEWQSRVSIVHQLIQMLPPDSVPVWAPPLCLEDAGKLDECIVNLCNRSFQHGKWETDWTSFNGVIYAVWYHRLPLEQKDLWLVLQAHGVPETTRISLLDFYQKGRDLLIYAIGRKPIRKKRVQPLSV